MSSLEKRGTISKKCILGVCYEKLCTLPFVGNRVWKVKIYARKKLNLSEEKDFVPKRVKDICMAYRPVHNLHWIKISSSKEPLTRKYESF